MIIIARECCNMLCLVQWLSYLWTGYISGQGISHDINLLAPGRGGFNLKLVIFKLVPRGDILNISCEIALRWILQVFIAWWLVNIG